MSTDAPRVWEPSQPRRGVRVTDCMGDHWERDGRNWCQRPPYITINNPDGSRGFDWNRVWIGMPWHDLLETFGPLTEEDGAA